MFYDAAGNMISQYDYESGRAKEMAYDSYNRVRKVVNPDSAGEFIGEYWYDDQGFRVRKLARRGSSPLNPPEGDFGEERLVEVLYPSMYFGIERQRTVDGDVILDNELATSYSVNNIYLDGVRVAAVIPSGDARYYLTDQVDSVKVVVDDDGMPVTRMEYLPYGETWFEEGDGNNAPKYNSQELDKETGYYFYNARHYDPEISRFVTADNVIDGEKKDKDGKIITSDTQGWNRYSYVRGNPIRYRDPTGYWKDESEWENNDETGNPELIIKGEVTEGDNLWNLSKKALEKEIGKKNVTNKLIKERTELIKEANGLESDVIKPGQKLLIGYKEIVEGAESNIVEDLALQAAAAFMIKATVDTAVVGGPIFARTALVMIKNAKTIAATTGTTVLTTGRKGCEVAKDVGSKAKNVVTNVDNIRKTADVGKGAVKNMTQSSPEVSNNREAAGWGMTEILKRVISSIDF